MPLSILNTITMNTGENFGQGLAINASGTEAYIASTITNNRDVVRVNLASFVRAGKTTLTGTAASTQQAGGYGTDGHFYCQDGPGNLYQIDSSTIIRQANLGATPASVLVHSLTNFCYVWSNTTLKRVFLNTFVADKTLATAIRGTRGVINSAGTIGYFSSNNSPDVIYKIDLTGNMSVLGSTILSSTGTVTHMTADLSNDVMYISLGGATGKIVKLRLSTMSEISTLTLPTNNSVTYTAIDEFNQLLYACTNAAGTGKVQLVNLSSFTVTDSVSLSGGAIPLGIGLDNTNGFVYVNDSSSPFKVYQIQGTPSISTGGKTFNKSRSPYNIYTNYYA